MNFVVFIRRFAIVFFSLCLLINVGYNAYACLSTLNFEKKSEKIGDVKIYISSLEDSNTIKNKYFSSDSGTYDLSVSYDFVDTDEVDYYLSVSLLDSDVNYFKKLLSENGYELAMISKQKHIREMKVGPDFSDKDSALKVRSFIKSKLYLDADLKKKPKKTKRMYCIYAKNVTLKQANMIAKLHEEADVKWIPKTTEK